MSNQTTGISSRIQAAIKAMVGHERNMRAQIDDDKYSVYARKVDAHFSTFVGSNDNLVFTTDADTDRLWQDYLDAAPPGHRQSRDCHTCRRFFKNYGHLVVINEKGEKTTALWPEKPGAPAYELANFVVRDRVAQAKVNGVFLSRNRVFGVAKDGDGWGHFYASNPRPHYDRLKTAGQRMAELREEHNMLAHGLGEHSEDVVRTAFMLLSTNSGLARAEKHKEMAEWLLNIHESFKGKPSDQRNNLLWLATAKAPAGWCHVKSGLIGTLLDDLQSRLPPDEVIRRFNEKIDPFAYMRPKAPPTAGNIKAAEKVVEKLGIEKSLERRHARLSDLQTMWTPAPRVSDEAKAKMGIFSHLIQTPPKQHLFAGKITWQKFQVTVLPHAESIEVVAPSHGNYTALVTAVHPDAPVIMQWGHHASWYVYQNGSPYQQWLDGFAGWKDVEAIVQRPSMWGDTEGKFARHGHGVVLVIKGCYDRQQAGISLFPEILKSELHEVRATIEAHSRSRKLAVDPRSAAGLGIIGNQGAKVRVTAGSMVTEYDIDRWD